MSQVGSYTTDASRGLNGLLADSGHDMFIASYAAEGASGLEFGLGVEAGTDAETQVVVYAGNTFSGVTVKSQVVSETSELASLDGASETDPVGVLRKGRIWVQTNEAVAAGDPVFCVNTGADAGKFRNDLANATAVSGAAYMAYDSDRSLALLELNLPA